MPALRQVSAPAAIGLIGDPDRLHRSSDALAEALAKLNLLQMRDDLLGVVSLAAHSRTP
jgi:hypothetical protein